MTSNISVVIPTRNRPEKLHRCLKALDEARKAISFNVHVCDSSTTPELQVSVTQICNSFEFVKYHFHDGQNVSAARNACAKFADTELIINVDDDVYVEPEAIKNLVDSFSRQSGLRVMGGSVAWGDNWSEPVIMRWIGYGRQLKPDESPSFLIGAFFIYPRSIATLLPWNERLDSSDDRFMGALWRGRGIKLLFEPNARAHHDNEHNSYGPERYHSHIYANLFEALISNPSLLRLVSYEVLGFLAGAKLYFRNPMTAYIYSRAWVRGHKFFVRDINYLRDYMKRDLSNISNL
jgi:glycosyltransferase involved in cell wall biosynthesis